jgi:hypothetical protein
MKVVYELSEYGNKIELFRADLIKIVLDESKSSDNRIKEIKRSILQSRLFPSQIVDEGCKVHSLSDKQLALVKSVLDGFREVIEDQNKLIESIKTVLKSEDQGDKKLELIGDLLM